jgi:dihydrodipicolinate synthase/N-acetylneuraminate lyase
MEEKKRIIKLAKHESQKKKTTIATGMQGQRVAVEMGRMGSSVVWFFFLAVLLYLCL